MEQVPMDTNESPSFASRISNAVFKLFQPQSPSPLSANGATSLSRRGFLGLLPKIGTVLVAAPFIQACSQKIDNFDRLVVKPGTEEANASVQGVVDIAKNFYKALGGISVDTDEALTAADNWRRRFQNTIRARIDALPVATPKITISGSGIADIPTVTPIPNTAPIPEEPTPSILAPINVQPPQAVPAPAAAPIIPPPSANPSFAQEIAKIYEQGKSNEAMSDEVRSAIHVDDVTTVFQNSDAVRDGHRIDRDGYPPWQPVQCVDTQIIFSEDYLGVLKQTLPGDLPHPAFDALVNNVNTGRNNPPSIMNITGNAKVGDDKYSYYLKLIKSDQPKALNRGDIIIFKISDYFKWSHIAIYIGEDDNGNLLVIDQNSDGAGAGLKIMKYPPTNFYGGIRVVYEFSNVRK